MTLGKDSINVSDKPLLIDALMLTILFNPSIVKCSFFLINSTTDLNNKKNSAPF
jgi:hypothetical protein